MKTVEPRSPFDRLADAYFRPKSFELDGRLYEWLGVTIFKRCLLVIAPIPGSSSYRLGDRSPRTIAAFVHRTRRNELIHLMGMLPGAIGVVATGSSGSWLLVIFAGLFLANFYPVILQRYNRIRARRVLRRLDR